MKTITVDFETDGTVKIETAGFAGNECLKATMDLERALGTSGARKHKPEMYYSVLAPKPALKQGR